MLIFLNKAQPGERKTWLICKLLAGTKTTNQRLTCRREEVMHRVIIFCNSASGVPSILIRSTLAALVSRDDLKLVAICIPKPQAFASIFWRHIRERAFFAIHSLSEPALMRRHTIPVPINLNQWARRFGFRVLIPPEGNINHPDFIAQLRNEIRPTIALSFYCLQKFSPDLLEVFRHAVNYHNGLLPAYRGLKATAWSVYHGEKETGFTFHRMNKELDEGPILAQGTVPVSPDSGTVDLDLEKAITATNYIPQVLRMVVGGDPGVPQKDKGKYFAKADYLAVTRIPDPSSLSIAELIRRLRAFGGLQIRIGDRWHKAAKIREIRERLRKRSCCCFRTSDGVLVEPVRLRHLPYALARGWIRKWLSGKVIP